MTYSVTDWVQAFQRHMPTGPIWSRDPSSVQAQSVAVLMPTWQRLAARDENLLVDAFPTTTIELLPEWESSLGLPDPCAGPNPTLAQRRAQVVARLTDGGGASVAYFVAFAQALGYDITITEFAPARAGLLRAGDPVNSEAWAFTWRVVAPGYTLSPFQADKSSAGDPLASWGNGVLKCEIQSRAPAHTIVQFGYTAPFLNDFGGDIG